MEKVYYFIHTDKLCITRDILCGETKKSLLFSGTFKSAYRKRYLKSLLGVVIFDKYRDAIKKAHALCVDGINKAEIEKKRWTYKALYFKKSMQDNNG